MKITLDTLAQHPGDEAVFTRLHRLADAHFLRHTEDYLRSELIARFADTQLLVRSGDDLIGAVLSLPLSWNGAVESLPVSREDAIIRAIGCRELNKPVNTLVALAVVAADPCDRDGLHPNILSALRHWAGQQGFSALMAAVRPTRKAEYPLTPLEQYINWRRTDGSPFDTELRIHWEMGASVLGAMPQAVTMEGDLGAWEHWTGTHFDESGEYIVDGSLRPVLIDCENDYGFYQEANVWMSYKPETPPSNHYGMN